MENIKTQVQLEQEHNVDKQRIAEQENAARREITAAEERELCELENSNDKMHAGLNLLLRNAGIEAERVQCELERICATGTAKEIADAKCAWIKARGELNRTENKISSERMINMTKFTQAKRALKIKYDNLRADNKGKFCKIMNEINEKFKNDCEVYGRWKKEQEEANRIQEVEL